MSETTNFHKNKKNEWLICQVSPDLCNFTEHITVPTSQVNSLTTREPANTPTRASQGHTGLPVTSIWDAKLQEAETHQIYLNKMLEEYPEYDSTSYTPLSSTPYTVGTLIDYLESRPQDALIRFSGGGVVDLHVWSWRGDYSAGQLLEVPAFTSSTTSDATVADLVACLKWYIGKGMEGYKGGVYLIRYNTPLYAEWDDSAYSEQYISGTRFNSQENTVFLERARPIDN